MPEKRFQIGDYWLSLEKNKSPVWRATWFDAKTRQTRRASLGTADFQQATEALAQFVVLRAQPKNEAPADMPLALIFVRYWHQHASKLASSEQAQYALAMWTEYWGASSVADLTPESQEDFMAWLKAKDFKNSYVSRILSVGRAAIYRSWKRGEILAKPFIVDEPDRSDRREPRRLSQEEMAKLLSAAQGWPHLLRFIMIMLNTLCRPDAALQLKPSQVDLNDKLVKLNPIGRKQTKKYRPIVPLTDTLAPFLRDPTVSHFVLWKGNSVLSVKKTFARAVQKAGLSPDVTPYSLRHTMAKELRKRGVPAWEVEGYLGHRRPGPTETYAEFAPDYLSKGREVIDDYFKEIGLCFDVALTSSVATA
jgi:integrase